MPTIERPPIPPFEVPPLPPNILAPTPTHDPATIRELGDSEWFFGLAASEFERGRSLRDQGRFLEAASAYKSAQAHHGKPSRVLENKIGSAYRLAGQDETAVLHFTNAIAIENSPVDRSNRAKSYINIGRCDLAINDAHIVLANQPERDTGYHSHAEAHYILGQCHLEQNNLDAALSHIQADLVLAQQHEYQPIEIATANFLEGTAYYLQNRIPEATAAYTKSIETSDNPAARTSRAWIYKSQNDCQRATHDAQIALSMEPTAQTDYHSHAEAHAVIGLCAFDNHDSATALDNLQSAISIMTQTGYPPEEVHEYQSLLAYLQQ